MFPHNTTNKKPRARTIFPNCPGSRKPFVFCTFPLFYFSTRDINTTHSTWLDCSRLMSDFCGRSREFIKACFCHKTHRFLPLSVLGNRSKTLLLPIICKSTYSPTASRLRSERTSLKSHRLDSNHHRAFHRVYMDLHELSFHSVDDHIPTHHVPVVMSVQIGRAHV